MVPNPIPPPDDPEPDPVPPSVVAVVAVVAGPASESPNASRPSAMSPPRSRRTPRRAPGHLRLTQRERRCAEPIARQHDHGGVAGADLVEVLDVVLGQRQRNAVVTTLVEPGERHVERIEPVDGGIEPGVGRHLDVASGVVQRVDDRRVGVGAGGRGHRRQGSHDDDHEGDDGGDERGQLPEVVRHGSILVLAMGRPPDAWRGDPSVVARAQRRRVGPPGSGIHIRRGGDGAASRWSPGPPPARLDLAIGRFP